MSQIVNYNCLCFAGFVYIKYYRITVSNHHYHHQHLLRLISKLARLRSFINNLHFYNSRFFTIIHTQPKILHVFLLLHKQLLFIQIIDSVNFVHNFQISTPLYPITIRLPLYISVCHTLRQHTLIKHQDDSTTLPHQLLSSRVTSQ